MMQAEPLAREEVLLSRNTLLVNLRFLDVALSQFALTPSPPPFATDGQRLYYDPRHVLLRYKEEKEQAVRDYLHLVFHCVFRHMYIRTLVEWTLWDLSCDIAVEEVINGLLLPSTAAKRQGDRAGALTQNLQAVNRETYDYTAFLKKFAVRGEVMRLDPDEFDYVYYTYGLKLYRNMPLIEPLECREVKRIREFVIAIDTSGSVAGKLVQKFVQKTYNVLKSTESFFSKINLHILQCDADIQEDVKITSQEEFDAYIKTMTIKGLGGTDFRPVFVYVDELRRGKEFQNLKGLIYFTDGYGDFPEKKPDYAAAFVFVEDAYNNPDVPPWAVKLVLQKYTGFDGDVTIPEGIKEIIRPIGDSGLVLIALHTSISNFSVADKPGACCGFAKAYLDGFLYHLFNLAVAEGQQAVQISPHQLHQISVADTHPLAGLWDVLALVSTGEIPVFLPFPLIRANQ